MTPKPPMKKILQRILHTEDESKQNYERTGSIKPQERKTSNQRVVLIQLHKIKFLNNKNN
jgi:hypothetical protein